MSILYGWCMFYSQKCFETKTDFKNNIKRYNQISINSFKRNYLHVRDGVKAFIHSLDNFTTMAGQAYNVGLSDANLSKKELCEVIKKQLPELYFTDAEIGKDPDKRDYIVSNEKIEKTGFTTDFSLDAGIAELIKGFQIIKRNQYSNV